ncbi:UNVERIFIED_CONTAM: hypothetical protein HDU68_009612 [Siphonaria sp. JEL0065]|nr:hypothetical protein HDU68_009612 [Siphonaria sp. JEL0065]
MKKDLASSKYWGLDGQSFWSNMSMVRPGISGFLNGDALRALTDFGIKAGVADSSRPKTMNPDRPLWRPLTTTVANNGFAGFNFIPRQVLDIFYDSTNQNYNTQTYDTLYKAIYKLSDIMAIEVTRNIHNLALLSWQPAMFHQSNARNADMPVVSFGAASGNQRLIAPVTLPPSVAIKDITKLPIGATIEQVGVDCVTVWIPLKANAVAVEVEFGNFPATSISAASSTTITISSAISTTTTTTAYSSTAARTTTTATTTTSSSTTSSARLPTISQQSFSIVSSSANPLTSTKSKTATTTTAKITTTSKSAGSPPACWTVWNPKKDYSVGDKVSYQKVNYIDQDTYGGEGAEPTFNTDGGWKSQGSSVPHTAQVQTRGLILSIGDASEEYPQTTFKSYGLDYDTVVISPTKLLNAPLNLEITPNAVGRYNAIVLTNGQMKAKFTNGSVLSTLYDWQWQQVRDYQSYYGVRVVALNDVPTATSYNGKLAGFNGATACKTDALNLTPASSLFTEPAGLKSNWTLSTNDVVFGGQCNFPASIVNATAIIPVLNFVSTGVAAAVIDSGNNRQQMSLFLPCDSVSTACATVGSIWFQWVTRGAYTGIRRIYFTPQVDDLFLSTPGNDENGKLVNFRLTPADIQGLIDWMPDINKRLPAGSNVTIEFAFNGNGVLQAISNQYPGYYINFDPNLTNAPMTWMKPLATGRTLWPNLANVDMKWAAAALAQDPLYNFFSAPGSLSSVSSKFLWVSHTFTHELLNNNSYSDTINEVTFNFNLASSKYWGLVGQPFWSNRSIVTPSISGFLNGDALHALDDFGIKAGVGDSSRPNTMNPMHPLWWPLTTTVANNGFDGFTIIPRQVLNIFYESTNQNFNTQTYNSRNQTNYTFSDIMALEVKRNVHALALLSWQPAMFHQANARNADMPVVSFGTVSGKWSLLQQWVENVFGTFARVSNWPIVSIKEDDLVQKFVNRQIYETASVNVVQLLNVDSGSVTIVGFNVTAAKDCTAPVTFPPRIAIKDITKLPVGATTEQVGFDSVTVWIPLKANATAVTIEFGNRAIISTTANTSTTTTPTIGAASTASPILITTNIAVGSSTLPLPLVILLVLLVLLPVLILLPRLLRAFRQSRLSPPTAHPKEVPLLGRSFKIAL